MPALAANEALSRSGSDLPVMLMTRPKRRACICGSSAWGNWRTRVKLSVSAVAHFSSGAGAVHQILARAERRQRRIANARCGVLIHHVGHDDRGADAAGRRDLLGQ